MDTNTMNNYMHVTSFNQLMNIALLKDNVNYMYLFYTFLVMQFIAYIPELKNMLMIYLKNRFKENKKNIINLYEKNVKNNDIKSSIIFKKNENDEIIKSLNNYISKLNNSVKLIYVNDYYVINNEEFEIDKNIYCKVLLNINESNSEINIEYEITIFSYVYELERLREFVNDIYTKYEYEKKNKLGNKIYYFDEIHIKLPKNNDNTIRYETAPKTLTFEMTEFKTSKSLSNTFGVHLETLKNRVKLFLNNPEWYYKRGIPYSLGILLHGPPGTGKTSTIKAIAKDTKRHIINIKLDENTTKTQLKNIFFNEELNVIVNNKTEKIIIPIKERLYVIEDIDCLTNITLDRDLYNSKDSKNINNLMNTNNNSSSNINHTNYNAYSFSHYAENIENFQTIGNNYTISDFKENKNIESFIKDDNEEDKTDKLNLSFLLNLLDGILECESRLLIVTTNKPERLDKAFKRPGRIDVQIEFGYCDIDMIKQIFFNFYSDSNIIENEDDIIESFNTLEYNNNITPSKLQKILLDNYQNPLDALNEIKTMEDTQ